MRYTQCCGNISHCSASSCKLSYRYRFCTAIRLNPNILDICVSASTVQPWHNQSLQVQIHHPVLSESRHIWNKLISYYNCNFVQFCFLKNERQVLHWRLHHSLNALSVQQRLPSTPTFCSEIFNYSRSNLYTDSSTQWNIYAFMHIHSQNIPNKSASPWYWMFGKGRDLENVPHHPGWWMSDETEPFWDTLLFFIRLLIVTHRSSHARVTLHANPFCTSMHTFIFSGSERGERHDVVVQVVLWKTLRAAAPSFVYEDWWWCGFLWR